MNNNSGLLDRFAKRVFHVLTRLPLRSEAEEGLSRYQLDNPALRFRRLLGQAEFELQRMEALMRLWAKSSRILGRCVWTFSIIAVIAFFPAASDARHALQRWNAAKEADVTLAPIAKSSGAFDMPSWKVTLPISVGFGFAGWVARRMKRRIQPRLQLAARRRDEFAVFLNRRRHIVPLESDCEVLEMQLERLTEKRQRKPRRARLERTSEISEFFSLQSIREKIALW